MRLTQWSTLKGKKLTILTKMSTSLGEIDVYYKATCHNIFKTRPLPVIGLRNLKFFNISGHYVPINFRKFLGKSAQDRIGNMTPPLNLGHKTYIFDLENNEVTSINDTKLEHLFGPNLRNWPLIALKLKFLNAMFTVSKDDPMLSELIFSTQGTSTDFLHTLSLCRMVKKTTFQVKPTPLEECLSKLFRI